MGLFNAFGSGIKGLFGEGFADRAAIASALVNGDAGAVAQIRAQQREQKDAQSKAEMQQQGALRAYAYFKAQGMDDNAAITLALDPHASAGFVSDRLKGRDYSASGGSHFDPVTNQTTMAPSRHEFQGSVFDVGGGPQGQTMNVTPQHEGTQWITPQPGTTAFGVNSFSGMPRGAEPSMAAPTGAAAPKSKAEYDALPPGTEYIAPDGSHRVKGGQTPQASGGFPN